MLSASTSWLAHVGENPRGTKKMAQPLGRLAGGTASPYTQKMLALLRYRRVPYAINWGQIEQACEALGVAQPKPVFMPTFFFEEENGLKAVTDSTPIGLYRLSH